MVQINFANREVNCKIVFYGCGRCGKTTNLQVVHAKAPTNSTGELVSIATETDRTLYFDFLPLDLGTVAGMRTKFSLYTVPGQVYYDATRKLVLQGADGVVFVVDSNPDLIDENLESLENLAKNLRENGIDINDLPVVLQYNKRDLPNAMPIDQLNGKLNKNDWPTVEAVAVNGDGVFKTLKIVSQMVIRKLNRAQGDADDDKGKSGAKSKAATAAPPPPPKGAPPPPLGAPPPPATKAAPPPPVATPVTASATSDPQPAAQPPTTSLPSRRPSAIAEAKSVSTRVRTSTLDSKLNPVSAELKRRKKEEKAVFDTEETTEVAPPQPLPRPAKSGERVVVLGLIAVIVVAGILLALKYLT